MVRRTDRPAMTIAVDLGRKATNKQTNKPYEYIETCILVLEIHDICHIRPFYFQGYRTHGLLRKLS